MGEKIEELRALLGAGIHFFVARAGFSSAQRTELGTKSLSVFQLFTDKLQMALSFLPDQNSRA